MVRRFFFDEKFFFASISVKRTLFTRAFDKNDFYLFKKFFAIFHLKIYLLFKNHFLKKSMKVDVNYSHIFTR